MLEAQSNRATGIAGNWEVPLLIQLSFVPVCLNTLVVVLWSVEEQTSAVADLFIYFPNNMKIGMEKFHQKIKIKIKIKIRKNVHKV